ncbi:MAG TPA: response regulator transcription factor [Luteimonas sp.]|nr:response regulator transcription factor [Luteimonas sp.]
MSLPEPSGMRVLIIEDQHDIAANLWDFLERRGHAVDHCADGVAGLARARAGGFDAIVLDLGLPRLDGLQLCRALREAGDGVPVLMLTARDTLEDKLRGYAEGADDYMVKPFALRELEARLRALHRRNAPAAAPLAHAGLGYDPAALVATREGRRIPLTRMQGALLAALLAQAPHVCSRERLLRTLWPEGEGDAAALHTLVYELRALVDRPFAQPLLASVRGVGYRIAEAA